MISAIEALIKTLIGFVQCLSMSDKLYPSFASPENIRWLMSAC